MQCCSNCGKHVEQYVPQGDTRSRYVCGVCQTIHYQNPKIIAGCIATWKNQLLLCRRAIKPRKGFWTFPAGFMENDETVEQAVIRETREEACIDIKDLNIYMIISVPHINQVHILYRAVLINDKFSAGDESIEASLFKEENIPWDNLAFKTVSYALENFFSDRRKNEYFVRSEKILI